MKSLELINKVTEGISATEVLDEDLKLVKGTVSSSDTGEFDFKPQHVWYVPKSSVQFAFSDEKGGTLAVVAGQSRLKYSKHVSFYDVEKVIKQALEFLDNAYDYTDVKIKDWVAY